MKHVLCAALVFLASGAQAAYDEGANKAIVNQTGEMSTSDEKISRSISDLLRTVSFARGYTLMSFTINKGEVILQGSVGTLDDKMRLEKAIRTINGVKTVKNQLSVRPQELSFNENYKRLYAHSGHKHAAAVTQDVASKSEDKQLNKTIRTQLKSQGLWEKYTAVRLRTNDGVVTLEGTIETANDQQNLVSTIQKISGVKSVKSNLTIRNTLKKS